MKVIFFTSYTATPHYETELELIQRHLANGDEVIQVVCNGSLELCVANKNSSLNQKTCTTCIDKRKKGAALLTQAVRTIDLAEYTQPIQAGEVLDFMNIGELKRFNVDNFDVGYAVSSTIISWTHQREPDLKNMDVSLKGLIKAALQTYHLFKKIIENERPAAVYIFNGRFFLERAAVRACQAMQTHFYTHERGNCKDFYAVYRNILPHSAKKKKDYIFSFWDKGGENREAIASDFYENRLKGINRSWKSHTAGQIEGKLPASWDPMRYNIVIYNSSDFEFAAIGDEWENKLFNTQTDAIVQIDSLLNEHPLEPEYKIYLRIHPHIQKHFHEEDDILKKLKHSKNIEVISSAADISSYAMLLKCNKVITFGSTMGPEATFWGKPSLMIGRSFYEELECTYNANSFEQLLALIKNKQLPPLPRTGALKLGFFFQTYGIPFKHYKAATLFEGEFKGVDLNAKELISARKKNISKRIFDKIAAILKQ